jgi:hypothetical protein
MRLSEFCNPSCSQFWVEHLYCYFGLDTPPKKNQPTMFKMCHHHMLTIQFGFCGMRSASSKLNFLWTMFMDIHKSATNCKFLRKKQEDRNGVREEFSLGTLDHWNICWMQRAWHLSNNVEKHDPYKTFPPCSSRAHRLLCHPCWF